MKFKRSQNDVIRTKCSECGGQGELFTKDVSCRIVKCKCGNVWDGVSGAAEQEVYNNLS